MSGRNKLRRRVWYTDPRLIVGVVLVVGAVGGTYAVVAHAQPEQRVVMANKTLVPGEQIGREDLDTVLVAIEGAAELYASAPEDVVGAVVIDPVGAGELVPSRAIGSPDEAESTRVVVPGGDTLPATVSAGSSVDIWAGAEDSPPRVLVTGATVAGVSEQSGLAAPRGDRGVEVIVPSADVAALLDAAGKGDDTVWVVQSAGAGGAAR